MSGHAAFQAGNTAVITGAADGIGLAAAECYAGLGMNVVLSDIDGDKLTLASEQISLIAEKNAARVIAEPTDVADIEQVQTLKQIAYNAFGRVDVLMNNAGTSVKTTAWANLDEWRHLMSVNLWGIIHGMQVFTQAMIDQGTPAVIINTGSKQGITNPPGNPAYNVTKAGVKAATESLQHALRNMENCAVSAHLLVPGFTYTGLIKRHVDSRPEGAWEPAQVVEYMMQAIAENRFYVICPDNEVSKEEDIRRILWSAGDLAFQRTPLSRWDPDFAQAFADFSIDE